MRYGNLKDIYKYQLDNSGSYTIANSSFAKKVIHLKPTSEISSDRTLTVSTVNGDIIEKPLNINCFASNNTAEYNIVAIGDSMTQPALWIKELIRLCSENNITLKSLGTINGSNSLATDIKTEGRAGWSTREYCTMQSFSSVNNAFWNSNTNKFDFSNYMSTNHQGKTCNVLAICLGVNDIGRVTMEQMITNYNEIIASAKIHNPNIKILIGLPPIRSKTDCVLENETDTPKQSHIALINEFDNKENQNIFIVPTYFNIDPYEDYTTEEVSLDGRGNCKYNYINGDHIIHPANNGYYHWADLWLNYIEYLTTL